MRPCFLSLCFINLYCLDLKIEGVVFLTSYIINVITVVNKILDTSKNPVIVQNAISTLSFTTWCNKNNTSAVTHR